MAAQEAPARVLDEPRLNYPGWTAARTSPVTVQMWKGRLRKVTRRIAEDEVKVYVRAVAGVIVAPARPDQ